MSKEQQELVSAIASYLQKSFGDQSPESMRKLFDRYDADGDAKINKDELGRLLKDVDIGNALTRNAWVRGIIDKLDTNADKTISWDEFHAVAAG